MKSKGRWYYCDPGWQFLCSCGWESKRAPTDLVGKELEAHKCKQALDSPAPTEASSLTTIVDN